MHTGSPFASARVNPRPSTTRVPMAVVVIGGVCVSTLLTLFVVPCVYSLLSGLESKHHMKEVHEAMKELG